jgi:putative transposase
MGISRSAYYDAPVMALDDTAIVEAMSAIRDEFEHYGWRRVQAALRQQGLVINHKKVKRLMREHDLQPRMRRRYVATKDSDHDHPTFRNLARDKVIDGANQLWVADITYVAVRRASFTSR